jgi:hypothetical protein
LEAVIKNLHETYQCRICSRKLHDDGKRRCPKHGEFYNKKKIGIISASGWLFKKKSPIILLPEEMQKENNLDLPGFDFPTHRNNTTSPTDITAAQN